MRILLFLCLMFAANLASAQKMNAKALKVGTPLPLSLWEYYTPDTLSFMYNAIGKISQYASCKTPADAPGAYPNIPGFTAVQNTLTQLNNLFGGMVTEPAIVMLSKPEYKTDQFIKELEQLGLKEVPSVLREYQKFAAKNSEKIMAGDEALSMKQWYYDSTFAAALSGQDGIYLGQLLRSNQFFVRNDGKAFDPKFTGTLAIKTPSGKTYEEMSLKNGIPTGYSANATLEGIPTSRSNMNDTYTASTYYDYAGNITSSDSTNNNTGYSEYLTYFPKGLPASKLITLMDGDTYKTTETCYFANGKISSVMRITDEGLYEVVSAFDQKGKPTVVNGTGKVYRESWDPTSNMSMMTVNEYKNGEMTGLVQQYINNVLINEYTMANNIIQGAFRIFHWKNGKLTNVTNYDNEGNWVSDNSFPENFPQIDPARVKVSAKIDPDIMCAPYGTCDAQFVAPKFKDQKAFEAALTKNYNLLHYNDDNQTPTEVVSYRTLTIDIDEKGMAQAIYEPEEKDAEVLKLLKCTPAMYQGKPVRTRANLNIETKW